MGGIPIRRGPQKLYAECWATDCLSCQRLSPLPPGRTKAFSLAANSLRIISYFVRYCKENLSPEKGRNSLAQARKPWAGRVGLDLSAGGATQSCFCALRFAARGPAAQGN